MGSLKKIAVTALLAGGLSLASVGASTPASAADTTPVLQTKACTSALVSLAKAQEKSLPSNAVVTRALSQCADGSVDLPKPQFAAITYKGRVVGGVFAVTEVNGKTTLFYQSGGPEKSITARLLNGNGRMKKWDVDNAPVVVAFAGMSHKGMMKAGLGEGVSYITITLDNVFGQMKTENSVPVPAPGSKVNVYGDFFGYARTVTGPVYEKKWATTEGMKFGIVTDQAGHVVGSSILFGTGYSSEAEWKFWKKRSYLMPLETIVAQSQGFYQ